MDLNVRVGGRSLHVGTIERTEEGSCLRPPAAPLFDQLVAVLEGAPASRRKRAPTRAEEARAAVALCLRWGSYLALLMDEDRPLAASARTPGRSRLTDREMARINIEASANLTRWLRLAHEERHRYARLVVAAQSLPLPPSPRGRPVVLTRMTEPAYRELISQMAAHVSAEEEEVRSAPLRVLANSFLKTCWRNKAIEDFHAGESDGVRVRERRFMAEETAAILQPTLAAFTDALDAFWAIEPLWDSPRFLQHVLAFRVTPTIGASRWTTIEENREIPLHEEEVT